MIQAHQNAKTARQYFIDDQALWTFDGTLWPQVTGTAVPVPGSEWKTESGDYYACERLTFSALSPFRW